MLQVQTEPWCRLYLTTPQCLLRSFQSPALSSLPSSWLRLLQMKSSHPQVAIAYHK